MWENSTVRKANSGEIPACLCKQLMRREPGRPSLRFSSVRGEYLMFCPSCRIQTYPSSNRQSVIAEWCGMNRPGDPYIAELWEEKYHRQQNAPVSPSGESQPCVTTDTH